MNLVCPHCLKTNDRHGRVSRAGEPGPARIQPGHVSVCISCGQPSMMTEHLALRRLTEAELLILWSDPAYVAFIRARRDLPR